MLDSAVMRMAETETMEKSGHPLQGQKELDAELVLTSFLLLSAHFWMADGDCLSHGPSLLSPPHEGSGNQTQCHVCSATPICKLLLVRVPV